MYTGTEKSLIYPDVTFFEEREGPRPIQQKRVELPFQARGSFVCTGAEIGSRPS